MTITLNDRKDFTLKSYQKVAWEGQPVTIGDQAIDRMRTYRQAFLNHIEDPDVVVYGVTSGYGQNAKLRFTKEQRLQNAKNPPFAATVSFGEEKMPIRVTRGMVFARLTNFISGHSAITPELAIKVAQMLKSDQIPDVPIQGNGGAGEILPLSHLFTDLAVNFDLREKDCLCLINGSPCGSALIADAALVAANRLEEISDVFALSWEALKAPMGHLDPLLGGLWGNEDEIEAIASLRARLEGGQTEDRRAYQAPVSFRVLPRYLGRAYGAVRRARQSAERCLKAVTDNPVYILPDAQHPTGRALSTGGYQNVEAAPIMNELAACYADLCSLAEKQASKMLDGTLSGLPDQLLNGPEDNRYMGCSGMAAVGIAEQARHWAQPTFLPASESGGYGQNDVASNAFPAWYKAIQAGRCMDQCLAILAAVSSQALFITNRKVPIKLQNKLSIIRNNFSPLETPRLMGPDLHKISTYFTSTIENH